MGQKPIFIIGAPRSGTSMLYYLLAAHPELAYIDIGLKGMINNRLIRIMDYARLPVLKSNKLHKYFLPKKGETQYELGLHFLGLDPELPQEGEKTYWRDLIFRISGQHYKDFDYSTFKKHPRIANRIRKRYEALLKRTGKRRFVDKDPFYTVWLEMIKYIFPDAYIVHIVRDGRAVVNSIACRFKTGLRSGKPWKGDGKWWGPNPTNWRIIEDRGVVERACYQWTDLVSRGRQGYDLFGSRYLEVRYEDIVENTRETILKVFKILGLDKFGEDIYPQHLENRNYKWRALEGKTFDDPIWTNQASISPSEYKYLEIMRPLLHSLEYVTNNEDIAS